MLSLLESCLGQWVIKIYMVSTVISREGTSAIANWNFVFQPHFLGLF